MSDMSFEAILARATTTTTTSTLFDHTWQKALAAVLIVVGVFLIVIASYFCCCRKSIRNRHRELKASRARDVEQQAQPSQEQTSGTEKGQYSAAGEEVHEVQAPLPVQLPTYTGNTEAGNQADGRMPSDQVAIHQNETSDPPPMYPGSPIQRPAELMARQ
jgi:hypothetical protein